VYRQHLKNVREYFANRPDDLLTLDICGGDAWEPLCSFLNVAVPAQPFPNTNRHEEKTACVAWIDKLEQAVREFQANVPANERYILIDEARLAGSMLEDPRRVRRALEHDGLYSGPPVDSVGAITEIEKLRATGINYLVIAWPAFWWLEYYAGFEPLLKNRFRTVLQNDRLLVMDMCVAANS
jgi:hypothetical protein